jgi:hypothetical protein
MAGTWTKQDKILPGAYINFLTNAPLSITPGDRGIVLLLQEMSVGAAGDIYEATATRNNYPEGVANSELMLAKEVLKNAQKVIIYNLGQEHNEASITSALNAVKTIDFNVLAYPYDGEGHNANKATITTWIKDAIAHEGKAVQGVLANHTGNYEGIINVTHGVKMSDGKVFSAADTTAWVAGCTAGASISRSNTGKKYAGAIDVVPRMTKTEMEDAITAGEFIFKVDSAQNVSVVYDINSLTTVSEEKGKQFSKNRVVRTLYGINNDITQIFESNYVGKMNNNADGRDLLRATIISYFDELQRLSAIKNFTTEDVKVETGNDLDAVVIDCYIQPVDSIEKMYITVSLA